jgi:hypothetical protein
MFIVFMHALCEGDVIAAGMARWGVPEYGLLGLYQNTLFFFFSYARKSFIYALGSLNSVTLGAHESIGQYPIT